MQIKQLRGWTLLLFLVALCGCKEDQEINVEVRPKNAISNECFIKALNSTNKEFVFAGERKESSYTYLDFNLSEDFTKKIADLKIPGSEKFQIKTESWIKRDGEQIKKIKFGITFESSKIDSLSKDDQERLLTLLRPYAAGIRALPDRLFTICYMQADPKLDITVECTKELCTTPAPPSEKAECHDTDSVSWWENAYCEGNSQCLEELKRDKAIPSGRCQRIKLLKQKTCPKLQGPVTDCLQKKRR